MRVIAALLIALIASVASAQVVIYPQQQYVQPPQVMIVPRIVYQQQPPIQIQIQQPTMPTQPPIQIPIEIQPPITIQPQCCWPFPIFRALRAIHQRKNGVYLIGVGR